MLEPSVLPEVNSGCPAASQGQQRLHCYLRQADLSRGEAPMLLALRLRLALNSALATACL